MPCSLRGIGHMCTWDKYVASLAWGKGRAGLVAATKGKNQRQVLDICLSNNKPQQVQKGPALIPFAYSKVSVRWGENWEKRKRGGKKKRKKRKRGKKKEKKKKGGRKERKEKKKEKKEKKRKTENSKVIFLWYF